MFRKVFFILIFSVSAATTASPAIYKWVDENGVTHFGGAPSGANSSRVEIRGINGYSPAAVPEAEPDTGKAKKSAPKIIMYSTDWCGVCKRAKAFFDGRSVRFTEYNFDTYSQANREY